MISPTLRKKFSVTIELKVDQLELPFGPAAPGSIEMVQIAPPILVDALLYRACSNGEELPAAINLSLEQLHKFLQVLAGEIATKTKES